MNQSIPQEQGANSEVLTEKDLHCIARMLQGSFCEHMPFFCCHEHCQYRWECAESLQQTQKIHFNTVRQKLNKLTGVWINRIEEPNPSNNKLLNQSPIEIGERNIMNEKKLIKQYLMAILERAAGDTASSTDVTVSPLIAQILLKII